MGQERKKHSVFNNSDVVVRRTESMVERGFSSGWNEMGASIEPLYNVYVGPSEVVVTFDLPYADADSVRLRIAGQDVIELRARTTRKITFHDLGMSHRKAEFDSYHARVGLPIAIDESGLRSRFKKGILEVRLPRVL